MSEKGNLKFYKYKHLIIAISIIIIIIILDIIFENYAKSSIEKVISNVNEINEVFENKKEEDYDNKKLEKLSINARKEWEKREDILSCFIEHEEVEKINVKLNLLCLEVKNDNWCDAKAATTEIQQLVKYLKGKYSLTLENIF